ncbi:MAG: hypothetical protein RLY31_1062 [Bacteroidota bacterium]|jgi:hypothetical protein
MHDHFLVAHSRFRILLAAGFFLLLCSSFLLYRIPDGMHPLPAERNLHQEALRQAASALLTDTLLPIGYNHLFAGSGTCQQCHGLDTLGIASVDADGHDVNVVDDWRATLMANSARDPFWQATVTHEVSLHPQHQAAIEDKCTACHAPMGHFNAKHLGASHYLLADAMQDALAMDGVSCLACHQQRQETLGLAFSGQLDYDTFKVAYGPYLAPLVSPMLTQTGYKPKHSPFMDDAEQCASCHTLVTETIGPDGEFTGNTFVEQATYHEWLNSTYAGNQSCQGCHMPNLDKWPVHLVTGAQTEPRNPFYLHELVGANVTMLRLLRDNIDELGLKASPGRFDEVIAATLRMLQDKTLDLAVQLADRSPDSATFLVRLRNKAGHKFPSGYPARRAVVSFLLRDSAAGDTLFHSGRMDDSYEVVGHDPVFEPHHQLITSPEQVQLYEQVLGDADGQVTTLLVRAAQSLKDNRLPPAGFSTEHPAYDTTRIVGNALEDPNFNRENGQEGSGTDTIWYKVALDDDAAAQVEVKVLYQSTPPRWMAPLLAASTPAIEQFRTMFESADKAPVLVQSAELAVAPLVALPPDRYPNLTRSAKVFPLLAPDGVIQVTAAFPHDITVYDLSGNLTHMEKDRQGTTRLSLERKGLFLVVVGDRTGWRQAEKVLVP